MVIIQNAHGVSEGGTMDVLRAFIYRKRSSSDRDKIHRKKFEFFAGLAVGLPGVPMGTI